MLLLIPREIDPCIINICLKILGQALNVPSASQKFDSLKYIQFWTVVNHKFIISFDYIFQKEGCPEIVFLSSKEGIKFNETGSSSFYFFLFLRFA